MLCFTLHLRAIFQVQAPRGAYIWRGDLTEGFLHYEFGGLIFGGAYTWRAGLSLRFQVGGYLLLVAGEVESSHGAPKNVERTIDSYTRCK